MTKTDLNAAVEACKAETREALQLLYDNVNRGQRMQLVKRESVKALFDRYGVTYAD